MSIHLPRKQQQQQQHAHGFTKNEKVKGKKNVTQYFG
jgi:hypothetical protein